MSYFSGQGRVFIGARDNNGNPQGLVYVGNVPDLKVSLSVETLEHQESQSGQRLTDLQPVCIELPAALQQARRSTIALPYTS